MGNLGSYLMPSMVRVGSYKNYIMQQGLNIELKNSNTDNLWTDWKSF